jgi:O-antigen/teichoic acid export membrane protein
MRVKYSILNVSAGLVSQFIITLLSFISRTVFINSLGAAYLGINGLFSNLLSMLSLAELGIGSSIIYSLYKPVAENDTEKINVLMKLYKKAYMIIGLIVLGLGIIMMPFLHLFMKGSQIEHTYLIYLLFLLNTALSYLWQNNITFLKVSQKSFIVTGTYSISSIIQTVSKIGIIYFTKNYILFLLVDMVITNVTTLFLSNRINKMYPFLKQKTKTKLDLETKRTIIKNVKALVLHNIGGYCVFGTDNIIISAFVSVVAVGIYSNYNMLLNICVTFINQIFDNINSSIGNLLAIEGEEKIFRVFKTTFLLNFWVYSFFSIFLLILLQPIMTLWIGQKYLMDFSAVVFIMLNFYVSGMRKAVSMVKSTAGIFHEDRYAPFFEAIINLVVSIILVQHVGITGVFIGTFISTITVPYWIAPYLVYKKVFKINVLYYFIKYFLYFFIGIFAYFITYWAGSLLTLSPFSNLVIRGILCLIIPNLIYILLFHRTAEFQYLAGVFKHTSEKLLFKFKHVKSFSQ